MSVHGTPTERGKHSTDGSYKHLAPMEPGKTVIIERIICTCSEPPEIYATQKKKGPPIAATLKVR